MPKSPATTVGEYLESLSEDHRAVIARVRQTILGALPKGYQESMHWGMISYEIPLAQYPDTYNKEPLMYAALAAQKNHYALYLMCVYQDDALMTRLQDAFDSAGKKFDMGKSCLRFRKLEDLPLDAVSDIIAAVPPKQFIAAYEASRKK